MLASVLLDICHETGIDFFTGVPDSLLKGLCDELFARYGANGQTHIVAHNEGGAVALCAGHFLATGRPALCYMQNSGLGNAVNPLVSLMDPQVYSLPCLLIIGWRGEPGVHDEPQHIRQGAVTLSLLDTMDIPYMILSADTDESSFREQFRCLASALSEGRPSAIVVRKNAIVSDQHPSYRNGLEMSRETAVSVILSETLPGDILVSTTGKLSRELYELREKRGEDHGRDFLTVGSMGHASMIALRIALRKPDRTVWCLDGDGAAMMHLGALPLIGQQFPARFMHVVINNGAHESVGGMPVCSGKLNLCGFARASGYREVFSADCEEALADTLRHARETSGNGPVFVEIRCACGARKDLGRPSATPAENRDAFMASLL